jgi:hypothetical protein
MLHFAGCLLPVPAIVNFSCPFVSQCCLASFWFQPGVQRAFTRGGPNMIVRVTSSRHFKHNLKNRNNNAQPAIVLAGGKNTAKSPSYSKSQQHWRTAW